MSTNFYIYNNDAGPRTSEHIGKRSAGWVFMFHAERQKTIREWQDRLSNITNGDYIVDEYGGIYTPEEFWEAVEDTKMWKGEPAKFSKIDVGSPRNVWINEGFTFHEYEFC